MEGGLEGGREREHRFKPKRICWATRVCPDVFEAMAVRSERLDDSEHLRPAERLLTLLTAWQRWQRGGRQAAGNPGVVARLNGLWE